MADAHLLGEQLALAFKNVGWDGHIFEAELMPHNSAGASKTDCVNSCCGPMAHLVRVPANLNARLG